MKSPSCLAGVARRVLVFGCFFAAASVPSGAATLVSYMGTDISANTQSLAADSGSVAVHLTASNLTQAVDAPNGNAAFSSTTDAFFGREDVVANDLATSLTNNDYITFSVTVESGYAMNLSSLTFQLGGTSGTSAYTTNAVVRSSLDSYANNIGSAFSQSIAANTSTATYGSKSADLTGAGFQSLVGTVVFRVYLWDNLAATTAYTRVDTMALNGTISAVPEPAGWSAIAGGAGLVWVALMRRRRC